MGEGKGFRSHFRHPAAVVLAAMVAAWWVTFGVLVWQRHDRFGSFGFDMGIFDQAIWLLARGDSFITVRGLDVFGHHANVAFVLLAPFSWLGAGPHFLNLLQVGSLGLGAVPVYLLGRHRLASPWWALVPAAALLLHPSLQFLAWELFHPETVALTPLLFAYLAAVHRRWGWYAGLTVFTVAWKEDLALAAAVLGLVVFIRGDRRVGAFTVAAALGWFVFVNQVLLTAVNGRGAFYNEWYGDLGSSPLEIVRNAVIHPSRVLERLTEPGALDFAWKLAAPFALVPLLAPLVLLMGVPQMLADVLSVNAFTRDYIFHYAAIPLAVLALASVEGLGRLARWRRSLLAPAAVGIVVAGLLATLRWGPSPIGDRYDEGFWPPAGDPTREAKEQAVAMVPGDARVSATYQFVPHLTHRRFIYEFPNPFRERNWGLRGEDTHDPSTIEWLVLDAAVMGPEDRALATELVASGEFEPVFSRQGVLVARRARAPGRGR